MSKDSEGLKSVEFLEDVDVPTAAHTKKWRCLGCGKEVYIPKGGDQVLATKIAHVNGLCCSGHSYDRQLDDYKLVTCEDHEEALREAVQKAVEDTKSQKEMEITKLILQAEQKGLISAGQAQQINDLREQLKEEVGEK